MVRISEPKPFYYKGGSKAVLLLHSFTSNTVDMKKLGSFLNREDYTCYAPLYKGHGYSAEHLILSTPREWWESAEEGYNFLKNEGYQHIAVIGVSLGGLLALKLGQKMNVTGIVTMSVPYKNEVFSLKKRVLSYAKYYKQSQGKEKDKISKEIDALEVNSTSSLLQFKDFIDLTIKGLPQVKQPISIMYGELDNPLYRESANYIYEKVSSLHKRIKGYSNSKHLMTLGQDKDAIHQDILSFLESLEW
ncbi:alpha/beta hydrolase [Bacillus sp. B1-b2]|uniref:alpha/beta hydrolase n=1 Tax=Bacillus sp. B1-b2 TaxID=2653201 RepID=UPI00126216BC|nr:alpha/beta fold hydrolase [Bacillus sp. B1-b2]KAB7672138.1 carboxylesterase [Bacillus sp. B1-b2]